MKFYFDYMLLINQLNNYSKKIKIEILKKKIFFELKISLLFCDIFYFLKKLKKQFHTINTRFRINRSQKALDNKSQIVKLLNKIMFEFDRKFFYNQNYFKIIILDQKVVVNIIKRKTNSIKQHFLECELTSYFIKNCSKKNLKSM